MTEPMSDARLDEIRELLAGWSYHCGHREPERIVRELLAEVDRMRALKVPARLVTPGAGSMAPEQAAEWQATWDELVARGVIHDFMLPPADPDPDAPLPLIPDRIPRRSEPRTRDYPVGG